MPNMKFSDYSNTITPPDLSIMLFENEGASNSFNTTFAQLKAAVAPTVGLGGVVFGGVGGVLSVDTSNLVWQNTTKRLGIGAPINVGVGPTQFPLSSFHIKQGAASLRIQSTANSSSADIIAIGSGTLADAKFEADRQSNAANAHLNFKTNGTPSWTIGMFAIPDQLQFALAIKLGRDNSSPAMTFTTSNRVGIGLGNVLPIASLQIAGNGVVLGSPTDLAKGLGTINTQNGVYENGLKISNQENPKRDVNEPVIALLTDTVIAITDFTTTLTPVSITSTGSTATVITALSHNLEIGVTVKIAGANEADYNGTFTVTFIGANTTFQYEMGGDPADTATGTLTWFARVVRLNTTFLQGGSASVAQTVTIKDEAGGASTDPIEVVTQGAGVMIDGADFYNITTDYGSVTLYSNGSDYFKTAVIV